MNLSAIQRRIGRLAAQLEPAETGAIVIAKGSGMLTQTSWTRFWRRSST